MYGVSGDFDRPGWEDTQRCPTLSKQNGNEDEGKVSVKGGRRRDSAGGVN